MAKVMFQGGIQSADFRAYLDLNQVSGVLAQVFKENPRRYDVATGREILEFVNAFRQEVSDGSLPKFDWDDLDLDAYYPLCGFEPIRWADSEGGGESETSFSRSFWARKDFLRGKDPRRGTSKYPRTYAARFLRIFGPREYDGDSVFIPEDRVMKITEAVARGLGLDLESVMRSLADYYLEHEDDVLEADRTFLRAGRKRLER